MTTTKTGQLRHITLSIFLALIIGLIPMAYCQAEVCGTAWSTPLIAGQNLDVGTVTITNDADNVYVSYQTDGSWVITETHLDVATSPDQLKQTPKGNAIPGKFAYATEHDPGIFEVTHTIEINQWPAGTQLFFAAHAVVINAGSSETAWGEGIGFPGKNWAMYFGYELQVCSGPPLNPGIIEFQDPYLFVGEGTISITVSLMRTQGSDGAVSVDVFSVDISAIAGEDYDSISTTVIFEDGETMKQVDVFILNDQFVELDEEFQLGLTNVVGAELGPNNTATITIIDDDGGVYY